MANIDGLPVNSAVTHAEFMSRTEDTSTTGSVNFQNVTESTSTTTGAIKTAGGLGVEKSLNVGINADVGNNLSVHADFEVDGVATITGALNTAEIAASGNISTTLDMSANNILAIGNVEAQTEMITPLITATTADVGTLNLTNAFTAPSLTVTADATIHGNLTVNGTTVTLNTATVDSEDPNITVNKTGNDASSEGAGLTVDRTGTKGSLVYANALASKFKIGDLASEAEVVTVSHTQILTNKTISGSSNTLTNIPAANLSGTIAIANGGTGQTTQTAAFDALSPLTTKGDLIVNDGTNDIRLAVGTNNFVLTADSTQASGIKWAAASGAAATKTVGAKISSGGIVSGETEDFINGSATYSGGSCTITLNTFFTTIGSVQCTLAGDVTAGTLGLISVYSASTTTIIITTSTPGVGNINRDFYITVTGT